MNITGGQLLYNGGNEFVDNWAGLGSSVTVSGTGFMSLGGNTVLLGGSGIGGVLNVDGGTLQVSGVKYNNGVGGINFNGGLLLASSAERIPDCQQRRASMISSIPAAAPSAITG